MIGSMKSIFIKLFHIYGRFRAIINTMLMVGIADLVIYSDAFVNLMFIPEAAPILIAAVLIGIPIMQYIRHKKDRKLELAENKAPWKIGSEHERDRP